jgi:cytochrome c oxidase subunit 4
MSEKIIPEKTYYFTFVGLLLLTLTTYLVAFLDLGWANLPLALAIASGKAVLIALYFMHARYSIWLTWVVIGAGLLWFGILFVLTMSDYLTRVPRLLQG